MKLNPVHREGTKNVMCSHYRDCLDHAARRYWQFWDCSECTHKSERESLGHGLSGHDSDLDPDLSWLTWEVEHQHVN